MGYSEHCRRCLGLHVAASQHAEAETEYEDVAVAHAVKEGRKSCSWSLSSQEDFGAAPQHLLELRFRESAASPCGRRASKRPDTRHCAGEGQAGTPAAQIDLPEGSQFSKFGPTERHTRTDAGTGGFHTPQGTH